MSVAGRLERSRPVLKERLFGLTNAQGNHGEDVKEVYYYLDATPSHSYLKMLYKYPQQEFPYGELVTQNARRDKHAPEYELLDTTVFDENRYFDVLIEYAKAAANDVLMRVTATNRGPETAELHLMPQIWFRNTWSWEPDAVVPKLAALDEHSLRIDHPAFPHYRCHFDGPCEILFCDNETRRSTPSSEKRYYKDAFHRYVINQDSAAVNPARVGTKAAAQWKLSLMPGETNTVCVRLEPNSLKSAFGDFSEIFAQRVDEANEFYDNLQSAVDSDARGSSRDKH